MASYDTLSKRLHELQQARFKEFEQELLRRNAMIERDTKLRFLQ